MNRIKQNGKAFGIMLEGWSADDASSSLVSNEYETTSAVWAQLKRRYAKTIVTGRVFCQSTQ